MKNNKRKLILIITISILIVAIIFISLFLILSNKKKIELEENKPLKYKISLYEGEYIGPLNAEYLPNGEGTFKYKQEIKPNIYETFIYTGFFINGKFEGPGKICSEKDNIIYKRGTFKNNELERVNVRDTVAFIKQNDIEGRYLSFYGTVEQLKDTVPNFKEFKINDGNNQNITFTIEMKDDIKIANGDLVEVSGMAGDQSLFVLNINNVGSKQQINQDIYKNITFGLNEEVTIKTEDSNYTIKINSIKRTSKRNEFSNKKPGDVYIIDYTYTNNGGKSEYIFDYNFKIIDEKNEIGDTYPNHIDKYAQKITKGISCTAEMCLCVNNASNRVKLQFYDNMYNDKPDAIFDLAIQ